MSSQHLNIASSEASNTSDDNTGCSSEDPEVTARLLTPLPSAPDNETEQNGRIEMVYDLSNPASETTISSSLSRRRGGGSSCSRRIPSTTSTSSSSLRQKNPGNRSETIGEEANAGRLRVSLDSGMAAVRRWIRSRPPPSPIQYRHEDGHIRNSGDDDLIDFSSQNSSASSTADDVIISQPRLQRITPPTILEEGVHDSQADHSPRQRALSEPDGVRIRDFLFQRALSAQRRRRYPGSTVRQPRWSRQRNRGNSIELTAAGSVAPPSSQLSSSAAEALYSPTRLRSTADQDLSTDSDRPEISTVEPAPGRDEAGSRQRGNSVDNSAQSDSVSDPNREARARWVIINRRFQVVITLVALVFSLLLFAILVCWVVLTSAYVVSIEKSCDVPLKAYFWLVTLQLILDVFRTDIMRLFLRWDANSNRRIPCRVITYNIGYLTYALLVLRLGLNSVFLDSGSTCLHTAPELFKSSTAFVSLSIAAWTTIILGYLVPFCFVAVLLTLNGYTPPTGNQRDGTASPFTVFPTAMSAPPGCVDQLQMLTLEEFPADYPMECCICMEKFTGVEVIVETECNHVFHKQCCREWLRQARSCPVCRMDIPAALENPEQRQRRGHRLGFGAASRPFARNDLHHEVVSLLHILRRRDRRRNESSEVTRSDGDGSRNQSIPVPLHDMAPDLEEGRSTIPEF